MRLRVEYLQGNRDKEPMFIYAPEPNEISIDFKNDAGETVSFSMTGNPEYLEKVVAFEVGSDESGGKMYCFWQRGTALDLIYREIRNLAYALKERFSQAATEDGVIAKMQSDDELEKMLKEAISAADDLLAGQVSRSFHVAQLTLVNSVVLQLIEGTTFTLRSDTQERTALVFDAQSMARKKQELSQEVTRWHRKRLGIRRGGDRRSKAKIDRLKEHFDQRVNDWCKAYLDCREALNSHRPEKREAWRLEVKNYNPDFPDDLIERLQPMTEWPNEISDICLEQGGEDRAEDIALEHAARLCGAESYAYKLATLQERYRKQNRENQK